MSESAVRKVPASAAGFDPAALIERFQAVRAQTEALAAPLSPEDQVVQSMADASPTKWHLAHTTWFFEAFILAADGPTARRFHPDYAFLFNSYYEGAGPRHARPRRGLVTRPNLAEVLAYRSHVTAAICALLSEGDETTLAAQLPLVALGLNHEQQHQELILRRLSP